MSDATSETSAPQDVGMEDQEDILKKGAEKQRKRREQYRASKQRSRARGKQLLKGAQEMFKDKEKVELSLEERFANWTVTKPEKIIAIAREDDRYMTFAFNRKKQVKRFSYLAHAIVLTREGMLRIFMTCDVLGYCSCKYKDKCFEKYGTHWHCLVKTPGVIDDFRRKCSMSLPERQPELRPESGKMQKSPPHIRFFGIKCERHLVYVMHYVSCLTASNRIHTKGRHEHFDLHGPIEKHLVLPNDRKCQKLKDRLMITLGAKHSSENCECYDGKQKKEKRAMWRMKSWAERGEAILRAYRLSNEKREPISRLSEEDLLKSVQSILEEMKETEGTVSQIRTDANACGD